MKRLLSIIIATAMLISFVPVFSASAEGEAVAEAETISYKISSDSISTAEVLPSAHFIPVETDEESENYGDLKFELRTYTTVDSTTTYDTTGIKYAEPTIKNLIYNFEGDYTGLSTSISNKEVGMLSYRPIEYWKHVAGANKTIKSYSPFRKFLASTMTLSGMKFGSSWGILYENGSPVERTLPPTLDLSKTAPFELYGKGLLSSHAWLEPAGYYGTFYIGTESDPDANFGKFGTISGPNFPVRIKIPEDAVAGKYTLRVGNNRTSGYGIYGDNNSARTFVYMTKIDPETGLEGLFDGYSNRGGLFAGFADNNGTVLERSAYAADENLLGTYTCLNQTATSFEKELEVAPGEEYIIYFEIDGSAIDQTALNSGDYDKATVYNYNKYLYQSFKLSYIDLVPVDTDYDASFDAVEESYTTSGTATVNTYAYTDGGTLIETIETGVVKNLGEKYTYTAPEKEGYNFLYWAKGASNDKIIVSYSKDLTYKPAEGANYLIAVYESAEGATAKAEFYNANGDRLEVKDSVAFPALPSLAGYGKAVGWYCYNDGKLYTGTETDVELSGTMIFVAKYSDTTNVVKVNEADKSYGELVTFTAEDVEGKVFKGWKKDGEIVSVSKTYSFYAYKDCTVEPIYADEEANFTGKFIKIIIDTFTSGDATSIMAEFIGLDHAVEKGIIVNGTRKIPMKTDSTQFTVEADVDGTYEGYAIVKDGTSFTQVTDGSEEVK